MEGGGVGRCENPTPPFPSPAQASRDGGGPSASRLRFSLHVLRSSRVYFCSAYTLRTASISASASLLCAPTDLWCFKTSIIAALI